MRQHLTSLVTLLVLFSIQSTAQIEEMTLQRAISLGLANNFSIKVDERSIAIAENNARWSLAGRAPVVDLNGFATNSLTDDNNPASFLQGAYYIGSFGGTLDATWVVYNGGRVLIAKDQLDLAVGQQRLNQESGMHDLIRQIYLDYYDVLLQQERLEVLEETLGLSKSRLDYEETKREFGNSNAYNLIQFENAVITDSNNLLSQQLQFELAQRNLYNTLQLQGFPTYAYNEVLSTAAEEIDEAKLRQTLSERNYTLRSLQVISDLDALNTQLEKASRLPQLSLSGSAGYSRNAFQFYADDPNTGEPFDLLWSTRLNGTVNANLNWNLYNGNSRQTAIQNAAIQQEISALNLNEARLQLENQLDILIANYQRQLSLLKLADEQLDVAEQNLEMTEERYKGGAITSLDFRNVQNQLLQAAFNKVSAIYNLIQTKTEIDYLVGRYSKEG